MAALPETLHTAIACPGCGRPIDVVAQLSSGDQRTVIATIDPQQLRAAFDAHLSNRHADLQPPHER